MKWASVGLTVVGVAGLLLFSSSARAQSPIGTAADFAVLAGMSVTNTGPTLISGGSVGVFSGSAITGFPPGVRFGAGAFHPGDATAADAQADLTAGYTTVSTLPCPQAGQLPSDAGGLTLTPGVHCFPTGPAGLTGTLTLDLQGNPNARFFIQAPGALFTASNSSVVLINSAGVTCPPNVYWQVGASATLGTSSAFKGTILALTSVTATAGTTVDGSMLARNGSVSLDTNAVTRCVATPEADVSVNATSAPAAVAPGEDVTYSIVATNDGPDTADTTSVTATVPSGLAFKSLVVPSGWSCTMPAVGASGTVTCEIASFAVGSANFALAATLGAAAASVPPIQVGVASATFDSDTSNDSFAADDTQVAVPPAPTPVPPTTTPTPTPPATSTPNPCTSRRSFMVQLRTFRRSLNTARIISARLQTLGGKSVRTLRVTRSRVTVDLRGLTKQRLVVQVTARTRSGKTVRVSRNYGTCDKSKS